MKITRRDNDTYTRVTVEEGYYDSVQVMSFRCKDEVSINSQWPRSMSLRTARKVATLLAEAIKQAEALEVEFDLVFEEAEEVPA